MSLRRRFTWFYIALLWLLLAPALLAQATTWATQANQLKGRLGQRFTLTIPGGGSHGGRLWGTNLYTDDSSIGLAAVHAGLITAAKGGTVTIELRPGASAYSGSTRNGVTSKSYGVWQGSFSFVTMPAMAPPVPRAPVPPPTAQPAPTPTVQTATVSAATWDTQANQLNGTVGQQFTLRIPGGGSLTGRLWGTNLYTDDSSIALAAVHAGLISAAQGGTVTIELRPGASSYQGSSRNGVASKTFGAWRGSFSFVAESAAPPPSRATPADSATWATQAKHLHGRIGQRFTLSLPGGGGLNGRLWGTDQYTDDSSIALAAVHAGLMSAVTGGTVTIELRPDAGSYRGSIRNGVTSQNYGSWTGSFVFVR